MRSVIFVTALIGCIVPVLVPPVACAITPDEAKPGPDVTIRLHGCVFADANGNRKQDPGEKPLAGVRVHDHRRTS